VSESIAVGRGDGRDAVTKRGVVLNETLVAPALTAPGKMFVEITEVAMFDLDASTEHALIQESPVYVEDRVSQARSQTDILLDVANKLQEARCDAQDLNDKLFLYFMDMAIYHACERLTNQSDLGEREKWN
jgi:hypothetical protein